MGMTQMLSAPVRRVGRSLAFRAVRAALRLFFRRCHFDRGRIILTASTGQRVAAAGKTVSLYQRCHYDV